MAQLTRPVVTMDLANRSIGRAGLLANRVMHPLVASRFGREVGTLAQISDVKVTPSLTGITVQGMECGKNHIILPLYAKFLLRSGVSEIALPKGTAEDRISDIFRTVTTRTPVKAERLLKDVSVEMANKGNKQEENRITWRELYNVAYQPRKVQPELYLGCGSLFIGPAYGGFSGIMSGIGYSNSLVSLASLTALGIISGFVIPAIAPPIAYRIYNIGIDISYILSRTKQVVGLGSINTVLLSHHSQNLVKAISPLDAREKIAKDPKTPVAVLMILASDHTPIFPRRFYDDIPAVAFDNINKKGLTADQLSILAESGSDEVRTKVAQHPNTPVDTLMKLGVRGSNAAFDHLNEKGLTPEQLVMLADSSSSNIREKVAQHPNTSVDALMKLALQDSIVAFDRLNEKGLSAEQLAVLADSQSSEVREKAAQHPNTPVDALRKLISYRDTILVAKHPNATPEIFADAVANLIIVEMDVISSISTTHTGPSNLMHEYIGGLEEAYGEYSSTRYFTIREVHYRTLPKQDKNEVLDILYKRGPKFAKIALDALESVLRKQSTNYTYEINDPIEDLRTAYQNACRMDPN